MRMVAGRMTVVRRWRRQASLFGLCLLAAGCAARQPLPPVSQPLPSPSSFVGVASWYGPGFDGRPTASGEIYRQEDLTAACNLLPIGARAMVTNLSNGRSLEVRINDRGPFVKGRKLDLSHRAAELLGITQPGTALVRVDPIGSPALLRALAMPSSYFVQVGSFSRYANAKRLDLELAGRTPNVSIDALNAGGMRYFRVRVGPFASRPDARREAQRIAGLGLPAIIMSR